MKLGSTRLLLYARALCATPRTRQGPALAPWPRSSRRRTSAEAVALTQALSDLIHPYKAHMNLGTAYERVRRPRNAGSRLQECRLSDESNPNPSSAPVTFSGCFMQLGRPRRCRRGISARHLTSRRPSRARTASIWSSTTSWPPAANRMSEAVDARLRHTADGGTLVLARGAGPPRRRAQGHTPLPARSAPRTPTPSCRCGLSGGDTTRSTQHGSLWQLMPSADDTGFSVSEEDLCRKQDKKG